MTSQKVELARETSSEVPRGLGNYLLLISDLLKEKGYVRGVELAERLEMSRPTVTRAMQRLAQLGFVDYEKYRGISLTPKGEAGSEEVRVRYQIVRGFLEASGERVEDVDGETRKLEPSCSDDVLSAMAAATKRLKNSR